MVGHMACHIAAKLQRTRHQEARAGLDDNPGWNVVDPAQLGFAHADLFCRVRWLQGAGCDPYSPACQGPLVARQAFPKGLRIVPGQQYLRCAGSQNHRLTGGWIEGHKVL